MKKARNPIKSQPSPEAGRKSSTAIAVDCADQVEDDWATKIGIGEIYGQVMNLATAGKNWMAMLVVR